MDGGTTGQGAERDPAQEGGRDGQPPDAGDRGAVELPRGERVVEGSDATCQPSCQRGQRERQGEGGGERDDRSQHACLTLDPRSRDSPLGASCRTRRRRGVTSDGTPCPPL